MALQTLMALQRWYIDTLSGAFTGNATSERYWSFDSDLGTDGARALGSHRCYEQ